ncbi:hypothetical protein L915_04408 [Phytophthora nicotianae]|uniref:Reverse transcriptase domain-containing protein n=2 Tax=Phytophthora nicotianae TaxID=4792 RepID=W2HCE9_PHYNI|nr:hypothetical protein L915_04408 [Phytophthora nicotianae]
MACKFGVNDPVTNASTPDDIDYTQVRFRSDMSKHGDLSLADAVRIFRGQTSDDPRPNKDLYELRPSSHPDIAETVTTWNEIVRHGVNPRWTATKPHLQTTRPANHRSIASHSRSIRRHLRKGQLEGRYLIVDAQLLDQWPEIFISPLAVIDKPGAAQNNDTRLINDYSFPPEDSVSDYTDRSDHPPISYNPPKAIARRIHQLKKSAKSALVRLMLGDVAGAFRHIPINATAVHMFSFLYEDVLVIDLACGFGWCGSPAYYAVAGKLINHYYEFGRGTTRIFTGNVWGDDHTCIEIDVGSRCFDANILLRRAMATVLGPSAINELKFTQWATVNKALGLLWDTEEGCVSIPEDKIGKAIGRVTEMLSARSFTKTAILKVLGSLRHVASCSRPARAFFQQLQVSANRMPRFGQRKLSAEAREDLLWFRTVLQHPERFNSIPVSQFAELSDPVVHVYMDASGEGRCALDPAHKRYLRQRFSLSEAQAQYPSITQCGTGRLALGSHVV